MRENFLDTECTVISSILSKKPVIVGKHLKVTSFNGLSISTKGNSSILLNPELGQVIELKSWVDANVDMLDDILSTKEYLHFSSSSLVAPSEDKYTTIQKI